MQKQLYFRGTDTCRSLHILSMIMDLVTLIFTNITFL